MSESDSQEGVAASSNSISGSEELESLFKTAKELIDEITSAQKRMEDEEEEMMKVEATTAETTTTTGDEDNIKMSDEEDEEHERLLDFERRFFPYLTKENLLLLLKTYKKIVALMSQKKKRDRTRRSSGGSPNDDEFVVNLERHLSLDDDHEEEAKSEMLYSGIKRIFSRSSSQTNLAKEATDDNEMNNTSLNENDDDLAKHLIVTNLPTELFSDSNVRAQFETLVLSLDARSKLFYFKPLKRCQIECDDFISALIIKFELDDYFFFNANLKVFVTKVRICKSTLFDDKTLTNLDLFFLFCHNHSQ